MPDFYIKGEKYRINQLGEITTPRLVVFREKVKGNLKRMKDYLNTISAGCGFDNLCVHVKTNKSSYITGMLLEEGITSFKSTPNEVNMLIDAGAEDIFVAYPLLQKGASFIAECIKDHSNIQFYIQVSSLEQAAILQQAASEYNIKWSYFIDIDVGMHRTGIEPEKVFELYREISNRPEFRFTGLHGYDGHIHYKEEEKRSCQTEKSMERLFSVFEVFSEQGVKIERVVAAGSPTFEMDLKILFNKIAKRTNLQVSPGTWVYWDTEYDGLLPDKFKMAALILARVIEVSSSNRITLNLGHKGWGADQGAVELFSREGMKVYSFNEEHTVLEHKENDSFKVGDYILIAPRHVCPTVNLYEYFTLIGAEGDIIEERSPVDARNR